MRDRLAEEMRWYDNYLLEGEVDRSANPTPGNKKGGLSNIVEKAMGSIAKSGTSPIVDVLSPAQRPQKHGMIFAATPASDIVCGPCQLASGIGLQVFMTGRGTPYGLAAAPVIKVCSRNEMKEQWPDLIDVCAGPIATGDKEIPEVGTELFNKILAVASGEEQPWAEKYRLHNYLCIFIRSCIFIQILDCAICQINFSNYFSFFIIISSFPSIYIILFFFLIEKIASNFSPFTHIVHLF